MPDDSMASLSFLMSNSDVGAVVGKGGGALKEIQESTGATISPQRKFLCNSTDRIVFLSGSTDAIEKAAADMCKAILNNPYPEESEIPFHPSMRLWNQESKGDLKAPLVTYNEKYPVHWKQVGAIIGPRGRIIQQIRQESRARIFVPTDVMNSKGEHLIVISGEQEHVEKARQLLDQALEEAEDQLFERSRRKRESDL
jgi:predicted RNA-binding protein YlqC (UPF0109 family)